MIGGLLLVVVLSRCRVVLRREQQRAAQLELKIAEMTDRAKDFEKLKADLLARMSAQDTEVQRLKRENDQASGMAGRE